MDKVGYHKSTNVGPFAYKNHECRGETAFMIHGISTSLFIWRKVMLYFVDSCDVIVPDLLGGDKSSKRLNPDYSIKSQAVLMKNMIQAIGLKATSGHYAQEDEPEIYSV